MVTLKIFLLSNIILFLGLIVIDAQVVILVGLVLNFILAIFTLLINHKQNRKITEVKETQKEIHNQINGQESKLLILTEKAGILTGNQQGRAELLVEQSTPAAHAPSEDIPKVEVTNAIENPVIVKPLDKKNK